MKYEKIILLIFFTLLISCNSQKIDLSELKFPISKNSIINEEIKLKKEPFIFDQNLTTYEYTESNMLSYNGTSLAGSLDENSTSYSGKNNLKLLVDEKKQQIQGYQLQTYTEEGSSILINSIRNKLGSPNYDDDDKVDRHIVWENKNSTYIFNISYHTKINSVKSVETVLFFINNDLEELIFHLNSISYYESYLKERKKKNKVFANYSYSTFAKEQQDNGTDYYLKGIKGLKSK